MPVPYPLPRAAQRQDHRLLGQRFRAETLRHQDEQAVHLRADVTERASADPAEL